VRPSHRPDGPGTRRDRGVRAVLAFALLALLTMAASPLAAQAGRIAGRVVNPQGEPVVAAQVAVQGTQLRASTDVQGRYTLAGVPAGTHAVTATALGYSSKTVTGVAVAAGATATLDLSLSSQVLQLEGLTVSVEAERGSTGALLTDRRNAATVQDAIGAEQMRQAPDGDAAAAVRRVPGVSVVDGKYVYVRGLGERYGQTTLNGASLPSPIPDRKAVPLDIIPTALLESVVTAKTYSPDQPGDYAGGLVQIETRNAPTERVLRASTSFGVVQGATGQQGLTYPGGAFLGFDDGSRGLPSGIARNAPVNGLPADPATRQALVRDLTAASWGPGDADVPFNGGFGLAYGNEVSVLGRPLGVVGTLSWSTGVTQPEDRAERIYAISGDAPVEQADFAATATAREATLGALFNASMRINDTDRVTGTVVYNRLAETEARVLSGTYENVGPYVDQYRVRYVDNSLASTQLRGEHFLAGLGELSLRWRMAYSHAGRLEPGTRTAIYTAAEENGERLFALSRTESGLLLHQDLSDNAWNPGVDLKLPAPFLGSTATLGFGGSADLRDRSVYARRIRLGAQTLTPGEQGLSPDDLFTEERIGDGPGQFTLGEATFAGDNYDADFRVWAGYALIDAELLRGLRLSGGARVEAAEMNVTPTNPLNQVLQEYPAASLQNTDVLPGVNLTWQATPDMNVRAAVSQTVARPQFRELAPYLYADYFGGQTLVGNPYLERTRILNTDLRWEMFLGSGSVVSVSGFYKRFDRPIEPVALVLGTNAALTYANGDHADLYGTEIELRGNLGRLMPALQELSLNSNVTLVHSSVTAGASQVFSFESPLQPDTILASSASRPLFGQSPYVVNAGLTWDHGATGSMATLLFNRFGRRLDAFGGQALPDVYEEGRTQLDFTVEQALPRGVALRFSATRLLGDRVRFTQSFPNGDKVVTRQYDLGRAFSLGLSWEP
jgi:outer membrane receptor protein involved in Fe transport